jgi:hypothetical protein
VTDAPPRDRVSDEEHELPLLPDPYLPALPGPEPPVRRPLSAMAVSSVVSALLLGPVGAILAILFGAYGRRETMRRDARVSGRGLATVGLALGVVLTPAWGGVLSYVAWRHSLTEAATQAEAGSPPEPAGVPARHAPPPDATSPSAAPTPSSALALVPPRTRLLHVGKVTVIDEGKATASLTEELARQRAEAAKEHETLMLMTTATRCDPCRGVDGALSDPLMQTALARVRLVRVDIEVFHEDLEGLRIPHDKVPGFFLLALDLTPRDGINGGEWDDDVAGNIAPVLGAFVREKYTKRRETWTPLPGNGMSL